MRVAIVDTYYSRFLSAHYRARPDVAGLSYQDTLSALMAARMGTSDAYSHGLRLHGHEAAEFVTNDPVLHKAWAQENGLRVPPGTTLPGRTSALSRRALGRRVLEAQLDAFEPEVVYVQDLFSLSSAQLATQRAAGRLVVGQIASPPPATELLRAYDLIVTSFPHFVERFEALGTRAVYLPLAFDERLVHEFPIGAPPNFDVVFVGGVGARYHAAGTALLERVSQRLPVHVWGYGAAELASGSPLAERHGGEAWGLDMMRVLASSRVCLNRHIDIAEGNANNMRLFEATGTGTLLCTEAAPNLEDMFEPGREVVAYSTEDDLVESIAALLDDEPRRADIAAAGHARTMRDHTYRVRMGQLAAILSDAVTVTDRHI